MPDEHTSNALGDMPQQDVSVTNAAQQNRYEISLDGDLAGFTQYLDRGDHRILSTPRSTRPSPAGAWPAS